MRTVPVQVTWIWLTLGATRALGADISLTSTLPEFAVTSWQMQQGLPSDRVRAVLQTRDSYIWIATFNGAVVITALRRRHHIRLEALERARLVERERGRIARDLHDDLGSGLTDISTTSALGQHPSVSLEEARGYFGEISQRSNEMVMALDEIVWAVNPKNDDLVHFGPLCLPGLGY